MSATKNTPRKNVADAGNWIRKDKRLAIYLRDGLCCVYCGEALEMGDARLTLDHVNPQSLGGSNHESNLVCACRRCNCAKQASSVRDFIAYLADNGVDTDGVPRRIRNHTRRRLKKYRAMAKQIIAARR
jgi:hypothetical protein